MVHIYFASSREERLSAETLMSFSEFEDGVYSMMNLRFAARVSYLTRILTI